MTVNSIDKDTGVVSWGPLAASVTGETLAVRRKSLLTGTIAVTGTFGGTVTIQGSLDGTNWFTLKDTQNADLTFTAAGLREVASAVPFVRPITGPGVAAATIRMAIGGL